MKKIINKQNWREITLVMLAIIFFFAHSWFPYQSSKGGEVKFPSPDAAANYFWAKKYAEGNKLTYYEPLNIIADDIVAPRSARSDKGVVKPVSFPGIILIYGWIAKAAGEWIIIYLTPLLAALGVLFFYAIIKRVFNKEAAFISALLLLPLAPYWYYASRSMFHNVLFVVLLLYGLWFLINGTRIEQTKRIGMNFFFVFLAGIFIGLAIITRTSEVIWLGPAMLLIWLAYFKQVKWDKLTLFICGIILALIPMFYYNQILYGGMLQFGYVGNATPSAPPLSLNEEGIGVVLNSSQPSSSSLLTQRGGIEGVKITLDKIKKFIPADFNIRQAGKSFINYYVIMFWYLFWPAFLGGLWFLWNYKKWQKGHWLYFISFIIISVILGLYYGSWEIQDNINPKSASIGNSYVRYWLPMYIMSLPLAALFFLRLSEWLEKIISARAFKHALQYILIIIFFILNFQAAVLAEEEGLLAMKDNLMKDKKLAAEAIMKVESEAVIITQHFDKFFWPRRKVIFGTLVDNKINARYAELIKQNTPLYYFGFVFSDEDMDYLNNRKLAEAGLGINEIKKYRERGLAIYKIIKKTTDVNP